MDVAASGALTDCGRATAVAGAGRLVADGSFADALDGLVRFETVSGDPSLHDRLQHYLDDGAGALLDELGFERSVHANPVPGGGPILIATRHERDGAPTVLTYAHGDVVAGMDGRWSEGRPPFRISDTIDRLYGRGTADNKGQHLVNLLALREVLAARGGDSGSTSRC